MSIVFSESLPHNLHLLRAPELGSVVGQLAADNEGQLVLLHFTFGDIPHKHRVTQLQAIQRYQRLCALCDLLSTRGNKSRVLILGKVCPSYARLLDVLNNVAAKYRVHFGMHAYCSSFVNLSSVLTNMPRTSDASVFTNQVRVAATTIADPTIKSRTYLPVVKDGMQTAVLKTSVVGAAASPTTSGLGISTLKLDLTKRG